MRLQSLRRLHTSRVLNGFRRGADGNAKNADSVLSSTPRKASGEFRWFEKAAPYGNLNKNAPQIPVDIIKVPVATKETLMQLKPADLVTWPGEVQAQLHHLGSYKPDQQHELFKSYVSLIREDTKQLWSKYVQPKQSLVLTGDSGVGKTSLLTQAHAAAKINQWSVIHIPRASDLLNGSTDAVYNPQTQLWEQPMFMGRLSKKTLKGNRDNQVITRDIRNSRTLQSLYESLGKETKVLVTIDNLNALTERIYAENTNQQNNKLYHNDLEVFNTLLQWFKAPPDNMAVIGATCGALKPIDWRGYAYAPLTDYDPALIEKLRGAQIAKVGHLSGEETKSFVDYLQAVEVTDKPWQELYSYGNGNPRTVLAEATNFSY